MATDAGELIVKISADIADMKASMQIASQAVGELGAGTVATGTIMADAFMKIGEKAVEFAKTCITAWGEEEQTLVRLTNLVGTDAADSMQKYAEQIQKTTSFSHDQVLAMDSQLASFGLMPDEIQKASGALINYAAQTGKTLPEAADVLGRAMAGNSRELKALGIEIFSTDDRATKFSNTIDGLNEKFPDVAAKMGDTTLGSLQKLGNAFNDLEQAIGKIVAGAGGGILKTFTDYIGTLVDKIKSLTSLKSLAEVLGLELLRGALADVMMSLQPFIAAWNALVNATGSVGVKMGLAKISLDGFKASLDAKLVSMQKDIAVSDQAGKVAVKAEQNKVVAISDTQRALDQYLSSLNHSITIAQIVSDNIVQIADLETQKKILDSQIALGKMEADQKEITTITDLETQKRLMSQQQSWEANAGFADQFTTKLQGDLDNTKADFVNMAQSMISTFAQSTAKMIVEGGKFSDVMKNLWKNIAEAFIAQVIRMIAEWMVLMALTGGGGMGFGFMADGGMVQEPSVLVGLKSGSRHMVGEAGPEMVVPTSQMSGGPGNYSFDSAPSVSGGGGGSGGGGITVNIQGQFLEGSASKWDALVREQIVPSIKKWTMASPSGPFVRKRGAA